MSHMLLTPFQRKQLQRNLETESSPEYRRRIEIMLLADAGYSQAQICDELGCAHATARYWIALAQAGNAHHWKNRPMGRPKTISPEFLDRLRELATHSPREYGYSFQRWTATWLAKQLEKELGIKVSSRYISQLLQKMGLSTRKQATTLTETTNLEMYSTMHSGTQPDTHSATSNAAIRVTINDLQATATTEIDWQINQIRIS